MAEEKASGDALSVPSDWQIGATPPMILANGEQASEWAMESYDMPPENVAFIQSLLAAEVEPSVIPIRRLPTR